MHWSAEGVILLTEYAWVSYRYRVLPDFVLTTTVTLRPKLLVTPIINVLHSTQSLPSASGGCVSFAFIPSTIRTTDWNTSFMLPVILDGLDMTANCELNNPFCESKHYVEPAPSKRRKRLSVCYDTQQRGDIPVNDIKFQSSSVSFRNPVVAAGLITADGMPVVI